MTLLRTMFNRSVLGAVLALIVLSTLSAAPLPQNAPISSGMGSDDTGAPRIGLQQRNPYQQFADRVKLDSKTQVPAVEQILAEAAREAAPVGQQMLQLRQQLVNLALENKPAEMKPIVDGYAVAAAKMAGIEARAFAKVYAMLKPNQQAGASQAFAIMAGMFQSPAPRGPGGRGGRGGGQR
jgi:2-hydroxychromene-2-carboxylate isomerase